MGLTSNSVGLNAVDSGLVIKKHSSADKVIAIAGNPNVGKSTIFNNLTGLKQHTGNWPGKTVANAQGYHSTEKNSYVLVDIPGTYSLMAHSAEEEIARNFLCFGNPDAVIVVCDGTCLERNLNLVLQTMEISKKVILCVNLMDEAGRKNIDIDLEKLSKVLKTPVVGTSIRDKDSLSKLMTAVDSIIDLDNDEVTNHHFKINYPDKIEAAISIIEPTVKELVGKKLNTRWLSLRLIDWDSSLMAELENHLGFDILSNNVLSDAISSAKSLLLDNGFEESILKNSVVKTILTKAEEVSETTVTCQNCDYNEFDRKLDRILTNKWTGYPIMILMLAVVFWITTTGANYPSQFLNKMFFAGQEQLTMIFNLFNAPDWLHGVLVLGVYRTLSWVISVMLPPMAIFFPLFTLLEDSGYLPRIAFNLDSKFRKCCACGKQALTMCMGFGCNAAGIVGCRIIDSPRERLIAMLTNNFVPCNGRFPILISVITMFFIGFDGSLGKNLLSATLLTLVILLGVLMTFVCSYLLSKTILKGMPSSFVLELPPYRVPQVRKVVVHSIFDRTLFVLGRAIVVAAPAGIVIWVLANVSVSGYTLLHHCSSFLDPFAALIGLDGVILMAFILGLPANEIVIPIIIMAYMSQGAMLEFDNLQSLRILLIDNGWTWITAINVMIFSLMHWPCSTTLLTIKKETNSWKWTALAFLIPTVFGIVLCFCFTTIAKIF